MVGIRAAQPALILDLHSTERVLIAGYLRHLGWRVVPCPTVREALELAASEHPSVMIVHLPLGDAVTAIRRVRALPGCSSLPIIAIAEDAAGCLALEAQGASVTMERPVDKVRLVAEIERLLARAPNSTTARPVRQRVRTERVPVVGPETEIAQPQAAATPLAAPGDRLLGYVVRRELGRGAYGVVYEAWDETLERAVALKVMFPGMSQDDGALARFRAEARILARLSHPNVVAIYQMGTDRGLTCIALEYAPLGTLRDELRRSRLLPVERALALIDGVLAGLASVHALGIIHRDLKPENVLLFAEDRPKITDFGIAHVPRPAAASPLTGPDVVLGTWLYMAPEQAAGRPVDARADLFAAGAMLYECLTGQSHIAAAARAPLPELVRALAHDPVIPPSALNLAVPVALDGVLAAALAKSPEQRTPDAGAFQRALREAHRSLVNTGDERGLGRD